MVLFKQHRFPGNSAILTRRYRIETQKIRRGIIPRPIDLLLSDFEVLGTSISEREHHQVTGVGGHGSKRLTEQTREVTRNV